VLQMDQLQEVRPLTESEIQTHKAAKNKIIGIAAMRKIRLQQRSRLTWICVGDANTKLFHLPANVNVRCRGNYIPVLHHEGRDWITHEAKSAALDAYFTQQLGRTTTWCNTLNWEALHLHRHELGDIDRKISEEEIQAAVMQTALEKAPRQDGFIGAFYKACWKLSRET
jgi:hypothetical protein